MRPSRLPLASIAAAFAAVVTTTPLLGCAPPPSATPEGVAEPSTTQSASPPVDEEVRERFAALERRRGGRLGVFAIDTGAGRLVGHRADERFALASTGKVLTAAVVLDQLSRRRLERRVHWTEAELVAWSPVTELFVADGMTIRQLVDAALTMSDNTAANLLFEQAGGPDAVDDWLAAMGDDVTSVDRTEPALNDWHPGEVRDTSTPRALASTLQRLLLGDALSRQDRLVLDDELGDSLTGARLVRAGVPDSFVVGDKSGSASYGTRNDVAIVRPPGRAPWIVVVMTSHDSPAADTDDALLAAATRIVVRALEAER